MRNKRTLVCNVASPHATRKDLEELKEVVQRAKKEGWKVFNIDLVSPAPSRKISYVATLYRVIEAEGNTFEETMTQIHSQTNETVSKLQDILGTCILVQFFLDPHDYDEMLKTKALLSMFE